MTLEAKLSLVLLASLLTLAGSSGLLLELGWPPWLSLQLGLLAALLAGLFLGRLVTARLNQGLDALTTGLLNFKDNDFSVSLNYRGHDELARLAALYNESAIRLSAERAHIYQRELMLDTVLQSSPMALLLCDDKERILYANPAAKQLLAGGHAITGLHLAELTACPQALLEAIAAPQDGLFTLPQEPDPEIWHLSRSRFQLNGQRHQLYLFKQLTRELSRAEVGTWKKLIRVISHELNNSLAPIASMANTGRQLLQNPDTALLTQIFDTISERSEHLHRFLQGYVRFARLPNPRQEVIEWQPLLSKLQDLVPFRVREALPCDHGWADPAQLTQVLVNLLKNAAEAGSAPRDTELAIRQQGGWHCLEVCDKGSGMSEAVLTQALLPFYSTKKGGTGLGLALCREIAEAHGGRLSLENRASGGLRVRIWLPMAS
ncbi:ATP-binding protein [Gallaecimonas kandeliae]|uniref:sensor histidine kinase n=1 Tax=Gallaecimonas kandeliae TaxID=3029055 RepID=UPI00264993C3|nr:ATP-binding protein [Gallaecimonas kandeliae]WKE65422.1 ATP-binding protein [Gallaecimonas kandeliae]